MKNKRGLLILVALFAITPPITPMFAQLPTVPVVVTGAGAATFGPGAVLSGLSLSTMRFGIGVDLPGDGTADFSMLTEIFRLNLRRWLSHTVCPTLASLRTAAKTCSPGIDVSWCERFRASARPAR